MVEPLVEEKIVGRAGIRPVSRSNLINTLNI
jgi:hypothetical protein